MEGLPEKIRFYLLSSSLASTVQRKNRPANTRQRRFEWRTADPEVSSEEPRGFKRNGVLEEQRANKKRKERDRGRVKVSDAGR